MQPHLDDVDWVNVCAKDLRINLNNVFGIRKETNQLKFPVQTEERSEILRFLVNECKVIISALNIYNILCAFHFRKREH